MSTETLSMSGSTSSSNLPVLELRGISKSFGPVHAIRNLDFRIGTNEVVGLIGENGAGKSTLLKILGGVYSPDKGDFFLNGSAVKLRTPSDAVDKGIGMVFQEQSLLLNLTVAENIHNGLPLAGRKLAQRFGVYRWKLVNERAETALRRAGTKISPTALAGDLTFAERQMVEIAKAVAIGESGGRSPLIVLDEATSILEPAEIDALEREIDRLKTFGSVIFVSHRMSEVIRVSDRIYVMRNGEVVAERSSKGVNERELIELMTGRTVVQERKRVSNAARAAAVPILSVTALSSGRSFQEVTLDVHPGEIVAIAGTNGSGREELMRTIFGVEKSTGGRISINQNQFEGSPSAAIRAGVGYLPAERRVEGIVAGTSVADNLCLTHPGKSAVGPLRLPGRRVDIANDWIARLSVRPPNPHADIGRLSGGNQQKIVLAKWLSAPNLTLLLLDHPLRGLDPGARDQVMELINDAGTKGIGVLLLADTIEEALEVGDRVIVMKDGKISGEFDLNLKVPAVAELLERMV